MPLKSAESEVSCINDGDGDAHGMCNGAIEEEHAENVGEDTWHWYSEGCLDFISPFSCHC